LVISTAGDNSGVGYFQVNQKAGMRWSSARGFLKPALMRRQNLKVVTGALVERVIIEDAWRGASPGRAMAGPSGTSPRPMAVSCCAAGAVQSPKLLELSGVGDGERLKALGIDVAHHSPGVGENLQDHLQLRPIYKVSGVPTLNEQYANVLRRPVMALDYAMRRRGPMTMAPSQMGAFAKLERADHATPNVQFHVQPLALDRNSARQCTRSRRSRSAYATCGPTAGAACMPTSPDAAAEPSIQPNYLAADSDRTTAIESMRLVRRIVDQPALKRFSPQEHAPGDHLQSDGELANAAGDIGTTIFHPGRHREDGRCLGRDGCGGRAAARARC
jgi:choline dehydrogenase-like flavoprotein